MNQVAIVFGEVLVLKFLFSFETKIKPFRIPSKCYFPICPFIFANDRSIFKFERSIVEEAKVLLDCFVVTVVVFKNFFELTTRFV